MKKFVFILLSLIIFGGCSNQPTNQLASDNCTNNYAALDERFKSLDESCREDRQKLNILTTENKVLKSELKKSQTNPKLLPDYKKVTFNGYTFQIPSSWTVNENAESNKFSYTFVEFLENDEVVSRFGCPLLETGYEFEKSFYEHDSRYYIANDEIYNFEMSLMEAENDDFRLGLILVRPIHHEPWEDSCQISGVANFDIYRNIYSSLTVEESSSSN